MSTHPNETRLLFSRNTVASGLHCLHALPTLLCLLAKRRKNASREKPEERIRLKKAARPREPCWRQTRRRSRACSTAGWGEIRHGRHRTQRCHFLKQLKPAFTQLSNRCALKQVILWYQTRVRSRTAEIKAMRKQEESWKTGGLVGLDQPFRANSGTLFILFTFPPLTFSLYSALFQPPISPDKPSSFRQEKQGLHVWMQG